MKLIERNLVPISLIIVATCVGYLFGNAVNGLVVGLLLVFGATVVFGSK